MDALDVDIIDRLRDGCHRLDYGGVRVFAKIRRDAPADFFAAEARGLEAIAATHSLRVPRIHYATRGAIVLEDLGSGSPAAGDWELAGRRLAALHASVNPYFGYPHDGFCGDATQSNAPDPDGFRFFARQRLLPQMRAALDRGLLDARDAQRIESVCRRLREWLPERPPALIHGDLWLGNLHACAGGELAAIDGGAVHYGWAECDLAMLTLFGEPPRAFFSAYSAQAGIGAEWRDRRGLLNLYHLLNHLNLFGPAYRPGLEAVLKQYA